MKSWKKKRDNPSLHMAAKKIFPRHVQVHCVLGLCHMVGRCQNPDRCDDGTGYMHYMATPTINVLLYKRVKCCKQPVAEPCADCPNVQGGKWFSIEEGDDVPF